MQSLDQVISSRPGAPTARPVVRGTRSVGRASLALAVCLAVACVLCAPLNAAAQDALPFAKSYTLAGDYAVGGVDLAPVAGGSGFLTGTIRMSGIPENADILAAFLYWETISTAKSQVDGARFRGAPLTVVKASSAQLTGASAACKPITGPSAVPTMTMYRADVLHLLPDQLDVTDSGSVTV